MGVYIWEPPELCTGVMDHENALSVLQSLPQHILEGIPVTICSASGNLEVLSVYMADDGQSLVIDVEIPNHDVHPRVRAGVRSVPGHKPVN